MQVKKQGTCLRPQPVIDSLLCFHGYPQPSEPHMASQIGRMGNVSEQNKARHNPSMCNLTTQLPPISLLGPILGEKKANKGSKTWKLKIKIRVKRILEFFPLLISEVLVITEDFMPCLD